MPMRKQQRRSFNSNCELEEIFESELSKSETLLIAQCKEAHLSAHAPYSNFHVGAAVLLDNERIITGSNQENVAYPSGLCAERVALFACGAQFPNNKIKALAVSAPDFNNKDQIPMPCGACRQVIQQFEHRQEDHYKVFLINPKGDIFLSKSAENLLPFPFNL